MNSSLSSASRIPDPASVLFQPKHPSLRLTENRGATKILAELRATLAVGGVNPDAILQRIVDAAQIVTDANGAAIALQHDTWVVCRARAGEMAPDVNSTLDRGSGISGECLRSGKTLVCHDTSADSRVDAAACRRLGLRSLAVVPIGEGPNVTGILEAFSARPYAFADLEVSLLKELAELVSAAQQGSAKPAPLFTPIEENLLSQALSFSRRKLIVAALVALALVTWLGVRKRLEHASVTAEAGAHPPTSESSPAAVNLSRPELKPERSIVNLDKVKTKPSAGVVMASKTAKFRGGEGVNAGPSPEAPANADRPLINGTAPRSQPPQPSNESAPIAPSVAEVSGSSDQAIAGLVSSSAVFPQPVLKYSGVLSGGTLEYKVNPIYPREAFIGRREGRVTLYGVVGEDGRLRKLKVVEGDPMLAGAAMQAVSQWRYHPYLLNGKPIRMDTTINLIFKLP